MVRRSSFPTKEISKMVQLDYEALFQQRRAYLQSLASLACDQQDALEAEDYTQLLELLTYKQTILGRFEEFSQEHPELVSRWHDDRNRLKRDVRERCEVLLEDMELALRELIESEESTSHQLNNRKFGLQNQMEQITVGSRAHSAYHDEPVSRSRLDLNR